MASRTDDGVADAGTAPDRTPSAGDGRGGGPGGPAGGPTLRPRPLAAVHRRRRAGALAGAVLAMVVVIVAVTGGAANIHKAVAHRAPPDLLARIELLAGQGSGSFAADLRTAETGAINRTLAYTPYVRIAGREHREIALTFDDGPGPYTPEVLDVLEREGVPGTFFEVGVLEQYFHASTARIVRDGFPIGDHTQDHAPMSHLPRSQQLSQLLGQTHAIGGYGAPFPRLFRPPYGYWNPTTLSLLAKYRMLMVLWTIDTDDYRLPGVAAIVHSAVSGARPGAIILLHDAGGNRSETVAALPIIIRQLRKRGYRLVTVPRLLLDNPPPRDQDVVPLAGSGG